MNINTRQYNSLRYKSPLAKNSENGLTSKNNQNLRFTSNIHKTINKATAKTVYKGANALINSINEALGDGYIQDLLSKAKLSIVDDTLTHSNRTLGKDAIRTFKALIDIPYRIAYGISKKTGKTFSEGGAMQKWVQKFEEEKAFNTVVDIFEEYARPAMPKDSQTIFQKIGNFFNKNLVQEFDIDSQKASRIFKNSIGSNITKVKKSYESRDERTLNRIATATVSALYSAADFYNISMLQKDDKKEATKAQNKRFKQEMTRMSLSAGLTYLSLGILDRYTKNNVWLNASVIAGSTLISEIASRLFSKTPLLPLTPEKAAKIAQQRAGKKEVSSQNNKNVSFKSNLHVEREAFRQLLKTNDTVQNTEKEEVKDIQENSKPTGKKKSKALKIFLGIFAAANIVYLGSRIIKGDFAYNKAKKAFVEQYKDAIDGNDLESIKEELIKIADKYKDRSDKFALDEKVEKLLTKRTVKTNLEELKNKLIELKETDSDIENIINIYLEHIEKTASKDGLIDSKVSIPVVSGLYSGITKIFKTVYTILSAPAAFVSSLINKQYKETSELFNDLKDQVKPNYKKELTELGQLCGISKDIKPVQAIKDKLNKSDFIKSVKRFFKIKETNNETIINTIKNRTRNVEIGAETSELANISRTMVTAFTTAFFVNDYRNSVLIESEGKDIEGAREETKERLLHKLSNFIINGTLMNTFNTIFKNPLNESLVKAALVAAGTETTNEFLVRKSICQPITKKHSKQEIIDYEERQLNKKGFMGWWSRTFKKLTGKKTLTQKAGINNDKKKTNA
ncbi:MAG: hypothetical protein IJB79_02950 [Candidatus Gastranaerophilales bacterium]|nr:hypothetical protein [Candidatus Gastranaerophilales bacterium]